jgi:hypothetical protein
MMDRRQFCFSKARSFFGAVVLSACIGGCGPGVTDAPDTFEISGYVNFDGEPVPAGMIVFENLATGNRVACSIEDGYYENQARKGHKGGKFGVQVSGFVNEGSGGMDGPRLWQGLWVTEVEFPAESVEKTFDISKDQVNAALSIAPEDDT